MSRNTESKGGFRPLFRQGPGEDSMRERVKSLTEQQISGQTLRPIDAQRLQADTDQIARFDRRRFISRIGAGVGAALLLAGGGLALYETDSEPTPELSEGNQFLVDIVNGLPDSGLKSYLIERTMPSFTSDEDRIVQRGNLRYLQHPSFVNEHLRTEDVIRVPGISLLNDFAPEADKIIPVPSSGKEIVDFTMPLIGRELSAEEIQSISIPVQIDSEGVTFPVVNVQYFPDKPLYDSLTTSIDITKPDLALIRADYRAIADAIIKFTYLKEAFSLLMFDFLSEQTFAEMEKLGLPTTIPGRDTGGEVRDVQAVIGGLIAISNMEGRFKEGLDGGGAILTLKALEGSAILQELQGLSSLTDIITSIQNVALSDEPTVIVEQVLALARENAEDLKAVGVLGDVTVFP